MKVISGKYKGRNLLTPKGDNTRPTTGMVKEALFNILQFSVQDAVVLDLFAGSGALGIECLSRGAKEVTFCEKDRAVTELIYKNLKMVEGDNYKVINSDFKRVLNNRARYDIIFLDAPYKSGLGAEALQIIADNGLLTVDGVVCFERQYSIPYALPAGLVLADARKYGDTALDFIKYENCGNNGKL